MATFRFMPYIAGAILAIAPLAYIEESGMNLRFFTVIPICGRYLIFAGILFGTGIYIFVFTVIEFMWGHFLLNNHEIIALMLGTVGGMIFILEDMRRNEVE